MKLNAKQLYLVVMALSDAETRERKKITLCDASPWLPSGLVRGIETRVNELGRLRQYFGDLLNQEEIKANGERPTIIGKQIFECRWFRLLHVKGFGFEVLTRVSR